MVSSIDFSNLSVLVVDDFISFRNTITSMLTKIGFKRIEEASKAAEMLKWCQSHTFDLVLCDYNLGSDRNGQNLLEEMHHRGYLKSKTLFVMVTAENSKEMVLSAYDCKPDDYLIKPINLKVLESRLKRLISGRDLLLPARESIADGQAEAGMALLQQAIEQGGRGKVQAQKMLGELYIEKGRWQDAEQLYQSVLNNRQLDWAMLGMAKVWINDGRLEDAEQGLNELLSKCRYYLPAYDVLSDIYIAQKRYTTLLKHVEEVVRICPASIVRQRTLAKLAEASGDVILQLEASHCAAKLGETSCYRSFDDVRRFIAAANHVLESNIEYRGLDLPKECSKVMIKASQTYQLSPHESTASEFLESRTLYVQGEDELAKKTYESAQLRYDNLSDHNIDTDIAKYECMVSAKMSDEAEDFLQSTVANYYDDESAKRRLDKYLIEPISEENQDRILDINKEGISLYRANRFSEAVDCFSNAILSFPRHLGLQLNYLQSLIAKVRTFPDNKHERNRLLFALDNIRGLVEGADEGQKQKFSQLNDLARKVMTESPAG